MPEVHKAPTGHFVYTLYRNGVAIYVGRTERLFTRLGQQAMNIGFDEYSFERCESFDGAVRKEAELIGALSPAYNSVRPTGLPHKSHNKPGARKRGRNGKKVSVYLSPATSAKLDELADHYRVSRSAIVNRVLKEEARARGYDV